MLFADSNVEQLHKFEIWCRFSCFIDEENDAQRCYLCKITGYEKQYLRLTKKYFC